MPVKVYGDSYLCLSGVALGRGYAACAAQIFGYLAPRGSTQGTYFGEALLGKCVGCLLG
jgi:hypothetical protein